MPSTGRPKKAKGRKSREMDDYLILSDYGNMDVMLEDGNSKTLEKDLDDVINGSGGQQEYESLPTEGVHLKKMKSEISIIEMALLSQMDSESQLKYYQVR